ncbi:hypothetical protein XELAEV_18028261mg, partial [Xenopus laevis]
MAAYKSLNEIESRALNRVLSSKRSYKAPTYSTELYNNSVYTLNMHITLSVGYMCHTLVPVSRIQISSLSLELHRQGSEVHEELQQSSDPARVFPAAQCEACGAAIGRGEGDQRRQEAKAGGERGHIHSPNKPVAGPIERRAAAAAAAEIYSHYTGRKDVVPLNPNPVVNSLTPFRYDREFLEIPLFRPNFPPAKFDLASLTDPSVASEWVLRCSTWYHKGYMIRGGSTLPYDCKPEVTSFEIFEGNLPGLLSQELHLQTLAYCTHSCTAERQPGASKHSRSVLFWGFPSDSASDSLPVKIVRSAIHAEILSAADKSFNRPIDQTTDLRRMKN